MAIYDPPGKTILLHSPHGLRIEFGATPEGGQLELWISPKAGEDSGVFYRNFSNRDDHTRVFDAVRFPGLGEAAFVRCDYDPFHAILHFTQNRLHLVPLLEGPALLFWMEEGGCVDFKSDKADTPRSRQACEFVVQHPDRGLDFEFAAACRDAAFWHQPVTDRGRSTHARLKAGKGSPCVLAAAWEEGRAAALARNLVSQDTGSLLNRQEELLRSLLHDGTIALRDSEDAQRLIDVNRKVLIAGQDLSGALRAALNRIYYMIWTRDGAITECFHAFTGRPADIAAWARFLLDNPTPIRDETPQGKAFLMLVNPITKWEEDGFFYAVWSVFTAWTQSGDAVWRTPGVLDVLDQAWDWIEARCYDESQQLYGRYFRCESPFKGSRDDGFDGAVGKATDHEPDVVYEGHSIRRSYDIYINALQHDACIMLAALHGKGPRAAFLLARARTLRDRMASWCSAERPDYGDLLDRQGQWCRASAYGLDVCDYIWALSVTWCLPQPEKHAQWRRHLLKDMLARPQGQFLAAWYSLLVAMDPQDGSEAEVLEALNMALAESVRPGKALPMPYTVVEMLGMEDGHLWHDVRPQAFSIGPMLAAYTSRGVRRLPMGLAVRPTQTLESLKSYRYRGRCLDFVFGDGLSLAINGTLLTHSLQLPESLLDSERNEVCVPSTASAPCADEPLLLASTVRLHAVEVHADRVVYHLEASGYARLMYSGPQVLRVHAGDTDLPWEVRGDEGTPWWLEFEHFGPTTVVLRRGAGQ